MQDGGTVKGWLMKQGKVGSLWGFKANLGKNVGSYFVRVASRGSEEEYRSGTEQSASGRIQGLESRKEETGSKTWYVVFERTIDLWRSLPPV